MIYPDSKYSILKNVLAQLLAPMHCSTPARSETTRTKARQRSLHNRTPNPIRQISGYIIWFCVFLLQTAIATADPAPITGIWKLDPKVSGDPTKELKGIRVVKRKKKPTSAGPDAKKGPLSGTQRRYWEYASEGKQRSYSKKLAHAGALQRILESQNLEILSVEDGYLIIYADGYERSIIPNPAGRVFTASGDELVKTDIGFTLAFWKNTNLHFETRIEGGGKLTERLTTSPDGNRLTVRIEIDRRDWKWIVNMDRVFDRVLVTSFGASTK
ncbi:MAG TPA: hypothetical protein DGR97_06580 [Gammaproteobacteria bacterium]|nr:hypothetical protein [Gammaproteobacteria bacterium]|tara:strand:- start:403 stop:1215 length:813 start_codon:yes stop_codon:yes gene_type:complete